MTLSDVQIERYSRQIIVARIGGRGQERILAARIAITGEWRDIESPLAYLVGAGVGAIELHFGAGNRTARGELATAMRSLNHEVSVSISSGAPTRQAGISLILIGSGNSIETAKGYANSACIKSSVVARLDSPGLVAVLPARSPCIRCADTSLMGPFGARGENSDFVTMVATAEAFKLAAGCIDNPAPALIAFKGYESTVRAASAPSGCVCSRQKGNR
ncbi:MAG TPA: hypothetical protein VMU16_15795 [Candidatus Binataceae bacterium]|nr:hypothetical protein [Candidatus Binataceae bacterium]